MADTNLWRDRNKVFVAGIPPHADDDALRAKFEPFGDMFQCKVVYDNHTGKSKGFGFVTFCDYVHALEAVNKLNQSKWEKRVLNVRFLQPKTEESSGQSTKPRGGTVISAQQYKTPKGPRPEGCMTVYTGNLSYDITEEILRKVFEKCGDIRAVRFAEHIQTKEFRGFGYVQFFTEEACKKAVEEYDGMIVMGRPMNVDYGSRDDSATEAREILQRKLKKGICKKFQTGECSRGGDCKFAHVLENQDAEELLPKERLPAPVTVGATFTSQDSTPSTQNLNEAPICINFQKGHCKRGDSCRFQHLSGPMNDLAGMSTQKDPNSPSVESKQHINPEDENTPICQNFQKGRCKRGNACRFRHVEAQSMLDNDSNKVSDPVRVEISTAVLPEVAVCQNFRRGKCFRGMSCRFAHTGQANYDSEKIHSKNTTLNKDSNGTGTDKVVVSGYQARFQSVCYNWQKMQSCIRGDQCTFSHGDIQIEGNEKIETKLKKRKKKDIDVEEYPEEIESSVHPELSKKDIKEKKKKKHKIKSNTE